MSGRISTAGQIACACGIAGMMLLPEVNGGAYLPVTGPTPLRFEVAITARPLAILSLAPTPAPSEKVRETISIPTTNFTLPLLPEPVSVSVSETNPPPVPSETTPPDSFAAHSAADNVLVITPQMLAEYFKPFPNATNAAGVSVFLPVQVGFTPPTEKNPASSRATYKGQ